MRQTLFYIPHALHDVPVFGMGWLLVGWVVVCLVLLIWLVRRQGWNADTRSYLPVFVVIGAAIWFVLPMLEQRPPVGPPLGLPIRGYGVMLLVGVIAGVALAVRSARREGVDPDAILSFAFWAFVGGIVGARAFYVIQYWPQFQRETLRATIGAILNVTQGGLVVYGSMIGGTVAGVWFIRRRRLPLWVVFDLVAPPLMLGLAVGRIGCLLNGCCYGGICEHGAIGIRFPAGSPAYVHQRSLGQLHGFTIARDGVTGDVVIASVAAASAAEAAGLAPGAVVQSINHRPVDSFQTAKDILATPALDLSLETDAGPVEVALDRYPERSRPVYPTQIFSAINAALLCLVLWAFHPFRRRSGAVFALMVTLYPVTRVLLEFIRTDEPGRWGTPLTISQIISLLVLVASGLLWWHLIHGVRGQTLENVG